MWFDKLDAGKQGTLSESAIRDGIREALPPASFAGQGGGRGRVGRGPGGGLKVNGGERSRQTAALQIARRPRASRPLPWPDPRDRGEMAGLE